MLNHEPWMCSDREKVKELLECTHKVFSWQLTFPCSVIKLQLTIFSSLFLCDQRDERVCKRKKWLPHFDLNLHLFPRFWSVAMTRQVRPSVVFRWYVSKPGCSLTGPLSLVESWRELRIGVSWFHVIPHRSERRESMSIEETMRMKKRTMIYYVQRPCEVQAYEYKGAHYGESTVIFRWNIALSVGKAPFRDL